MAREGRDHRSGETNGVASPSLPGGEVRCRWISSPSGPEFLLLEALFSSTALVALAEIGDKTQLLAILLATRFRKPVPIVLGILVATLANHFLAALVGSSAAELLSGAWFRYLIAASFIAMGLWTLIPDKIDDLEDKPARFGAFLTTAIAFFLVEMGDKTQLATVALGAKFHNVWAVTAGTTIGMMLANVPAVFLGNALLQRVPLKLVHGIAAALFLAAGVWMLVETAGWL